MSSNTVQPITDEQLAKIEQHAEAACQYAEDGWFGFDVFSTMFSPDDAQYLAVSHPFAVRALIARLRAAEKVAKRYLWLRDGNGYFPEENFLRGGPELDAAIDAEMHQG